MRRKLFSIWGHQHQISVYITDLPPFPLIESLHIHFFVLLYLWSNHPSGWSIYLPDSVIGYHCHIPV